MSSANTDRHVIFNAEPVGFSQRARALWESVGNYQQGAIDDPAGEQSRQETTVLIVRLARRIDAQVLSGFPCLRWLVSATTGLDHIDLDALAARDIRLLSLRGENAFLGTIPSTAEHTMALMLALLRQVPSAVRSVAAGKWQRDLFRGRQLKDRRLGLVGLGRTGRMVAGYAQAFGMQVGFHDPYITDPQVAEADPSWRRHESLHELLRNSEIISLHLHLDASTHGLIGADQLQLLPQGAWLVNTSRGALLDEAAVVERLRDGHLAGVASDVLAGELDDIAGSPLWQAMRDGLPVLITPHLGGATSDAMQQCEEFIAGEFIRRLSA